MEFSQGFAVPCFCLIIISNGFSLMLSNIIQINAHNMCAIIRINSTSIKHFTGQGSALKRKCQFGEMFITGSTGSCQNDNFLCSKWWKFRQYDISVSVRQNQLSVTYGMPSCHSVVSHTWRSRPRCWCPVHHTWSWSSAGGPCWLSTPLPRCMWWRRRHTDTWSLQITCRRYYAGTYIHNTNTSHPMDHPGSLVCRVFKVVSMY